eukprot:GFUD01031207.1.p1 GENE.GFUD01031207.1~~GFUD01031207.1.p1  ORF type:complete len:618 (-),score=129.07 GFUD01031207.1:1525-3378(-)
MAESNDSKDSSKDGGKPKPSFSPFSPFPYGSPLAQGSLQSSFSGSPGQRLLLGSLNQTRSNGEIITPRLKGQDLYGGPVMFGCASSARRSRLQSASPYSAALRTRNADRRARQGPLIFPPALGAQQSSLPPSSLPSTAPSSPHSSPGPPSSPPAPLSSTARLILSTLDRLSTGGTPITDAKKIPLVSTSPNRAEKRKLLEAELNCSLSSPSRRRARLGGGGLALALAGPPLRKNYSPSLGSLPSLGGSRPNSAGGLNPRPQPGVDLHPPPQPRLPTVHPEVPQSAPQSAPTTNISSDFPPRLAGSVGFSKTKSSFKVKTKVTDSARQKVDLSSTEPPPSPPHFPAGLPQLKVDKMPVFNLTSTPAPSKAAPVASKPSTTTSNGVSSHQPQLGPETIEKNNNKSHQKRLLEETDDCDSFKKQRASVTREPEFSSTEKSRPIPQPPTSANNGPSLAEPVEAKRHPNVIKNPVTHPPPKYSFSAPVTVIDQVESVTEASKNFNFSSPKFVKLSEAGTLTNGPPTSGDKNSHSPNFRVGGGLVNSTSSLNTNFKFNNLSSMPDVTNNLMKKSPSKDKLKGSNSSSRLPDLTVSTGFGGFVPAKELKTGSVMDILGFQNSGF